MLILNDHQELRVVRYGDFDYELVIRTRREDGSTESMYPLGLTFTGASQEDLKSIQVAINVAFINEVISVKRV
jgi:hypothetical protein